MINENEYTFAILALGHLGDTVLVEPLCRNIRINYPKSKIIFIVNDVFKEVAFGFDSVDEVYGYDKLNKHKGITGYFKFAKQFKNIKKIDYAIITHPHERSIFTAKIIKAKNIISLPVKHSPFNAFINKKRERNEFELHNTYKGDFNSKYISPICNFKKYPVTYYRNDINNNEIKQKFNLPSEYIVLSPTSKQTVKDWDYINIKKFILKNIYTTVLVGTKKAEEIAKRLEEDNVKFINLTNKTTISELGAIIKNAQTCVSVDTGTFHLSYAQNVKTIGLFFNSRMTREWVPKTRECVKIIEGRKSEYGNSVICEKDITAEDVLKELSSIEYQRDKCLFFM